MMTITGIQWKMDRIYYLLHVTDQKLICNLYVEYFYSFTVFKGQVAFLQSIKKNFKWNLLCINFDTSLKCFMEMSLLSNVHVLFYFLLISGKNCRWFDLNQRTIARIFLGNACYMHNHRIYLIYWIKAALWLSPRQSYSGHQRDRYNVQFVFLLCHL